MNFLSMKYFSAVAEKRSITKAAEQLHITQQTLSAHIAAIEKETGCQLLIRRSPLELTYAGTIFLNYANQFYKLYRSMEQELADVRSEERGILHIGVAHTRGRAIMPELISRYQRVYPKMEILITEASNDVLTQKLIDQELDLILANFPDNLPEIHSQVFYQEEVVLLVARSLLEKLYGVKTDEVIRFVQTRQNISALIECPFLLSNQDDIAGRIGDQIIAQAALIPRISTRSSNIETLLELCAKGKGACFCPDMLADITLLDDRLSALEMFHFGPEACYQIKFGWRSQGYCRKAIYNFIEIASAWEKQ